jgi:hypothetical protein
VAKLVAAAAAAAAAMVVVALVMAAVADKDEAIGAAVRRAVPFFSLGLPAFDLVSFADFAGTWSEVLAAARAARSAAIVLRTISNRSCCCGVRST